MVTAAQWEFDEESFEDITEEAKNFISSLLNKDPRSFYRHGAKTLPQTQFSVSLTIFFVSVRRRMCCEEGLVHPWMKKFDSEDLSSTKCLSKDKMKRFLARQKWKVRRNIFPLKLSGAVV